MTAQPDERTNEQRATAAWESLLAKKEAEVVALQEALRQLIEETMSDDFYTCPDEYLSPGELAVRNALRQ